MKEKEFGKLSSQEFRRLFALIHESSQEKEEFEKDLKDNPEQFSKFLNNIAPWSVYYELPYAHFYALFFVATGMDEQVIELSKSEDPDVAVIEWAESDPDSELNIEELSKEEQSVLFGLFIAMIRNFTSMQLFHVTINELLIKARNGDDDALLDAIYVDRHVLNCPTSTLRIARAEAREEENFLDALSRAIKRSRPRRPSKEYDITRVMLTALDQAKGLDNISYESIHDLFVDDLQIYPDDKKDSFSGLKKLIQRRKKAVGT